MKKAIDFYAIGKQKEVEAWKGTSISANANRFFCPECMESVALDRRGHFRHKNRTMQSLECERRVDSPSRSAYEKMGLPLYLLEQPKGVFSLNIGFPSLSETLLSKASEAKDYFTISNMSSVKSKFYISSERFSDAHYTLIKVDYPPKNNGKYQINYSNSTPRQIRNTWTESSDIWGAAQFYKCGDPRSRKIRQLGSITADQDYYFTGDIWLFKKFTQIMTINKYGELYFNTRNIPVFKIRINSNNSYTSLFSELSYLLMEHYKINLLIKDSSIEPIWPPCIIDDNYFIYDANYDKAIFYVNSPNDSPSIYRYHNNTYSLIPYDQNNSLLVLPLTFTEIPISVDKAFNGNIQYIRKQVLSPFLEKVQVSLTSLEGEKVTDLKYINISKLKLLVNTNTPCKVLIIGQSRQRFISITNNSGEIDELKWGDQIKVFTRNWNLVYEYKLENIKAQTNKDKYFLDYETLNHPPYIRVDNHIRALCKKMNPNEYIKKYLLTGFIPTTIVNELRKREKEGTLC